MKYKVWVYGKPFSGKSHFADTFPNAFVINTDGNLQFYKNSEGVHVTNYKEFVSALQSFDTTKYDTLVIDVLDHVYDMCREEFLNNNNISHESDYETTGAYGKGWTLLREQFWYMISKVRNVDAHLVMISHDAESEVKGKLGTTRTKYEPATIPSKIVSKITGIMHFVGRCYKDDEEFKVSFGANDNELSGYRLPITDLEIENNFDDFINNLK